MYHYLHSLKSHTNLKWVIKNKEEDEGWWNISCDLYLLLLEIYIVFVVVIIAQTGRILLFHKKVLFLFMVVT